MPRFKVERTLDVRLSVTYAIDGAQNEGEAINLVKQHDPKELLTNVNHPMVDSVVGKSMVVANVNMASLGRDEKTARKI